MQSAPLAECLAMFVGIWKSKLFWDRCEIFFAFATALLSGLTALLPASNKAALFLTAMTFVGLVAGSKWRSKTIDEIEKSKRDQREQEERSHWKLTVGALKVRWSLTISSEPQNRLNSVRQLRGPRQNADWCLARRSSQEVFSSRSHRGAI